MDKPILSKQAFKNVDMDEIDYENGTLNILERVRYRGSSEDVKAHVKFYGEKWFRRNNKYKMFWAQGS